MIKGYVALLSWDQSDLIVWDTVAGNNLQALLPSLTAAAKCHHLQDFKGFDNRATKDCRVAISPTMSGGRLISPIKTTIMPT